MFTGNNDLWLKLWYEIDRLKLFVGQKPYNKGGEYWKWYGNNDYVISWGNDGANIMNYPGAGNINTNLYFRRCITWSLVTSYKPSFRIILDRYHVMGDAGPIAQSDDENTLYLLGLLNSKHIEKVASLIAPTINFSNGVAGLLPVIVDHLQKDSVERCVEVCINHSRADWDSFETSWDFKCHPLVRLARGGRE